MPEQPDRFVGQPGRHLALVGPTASGKSAVAMELARSRNAQGLPTEIVSCDSMQVYRRMDIGTAKPSVSEREEIPHHLIDLVDPWEDHDLVMFLRAARAVLADIESRGASAVVVGGTGLYFRGVVDGLTPPPQFPAIAAELDSDPDTAALAQRLAELDPLALSRIPPGNRRRIIRALEVTLGTGVPFSAHGDAMGRYEPTPFVVVGLRPDRERLTTAINQRLDRQMDEGFLAEVADLHGLEPPMSRNARHALGYRELLGHLEDGVALDESLRTARIRTRRFAVSQLRWFNRDPRINWLDPGDGPPPVSALAARIGEQLWKPAAGGSGRTATVN